MSEEKRPTARQLVESMPKYFRPEKAEGVNAVIQYHLTGEGGGDWVVRIADGTCTVEEGVAENPTLTLKMDANDYVDLITGKLDGMTAFMTGKLQLEGDFTLATRLQSFFGL